MTRFLWRLYGGLYECGNGIASILDLTTSLLIKKLGGSFLSMVSKTTLGLRTLGPPPLRAQGPGGSSGPGQSKGRGGRRTSFYHALSYFQTVPVLTLRLPTL